VSDIKLDRQEIHSDDIGEVVGDFHGTPIYVVDFEAIEQRVVLDIRRRMAASRLYSAQHPQEVTQ
jgi:hypothetical protein